MNTIQHRSWVLLWLAELERRQKRPLADNDRVRDSLDRVLSNAEALHSCTGSGFEAFANVSRHRHPLTGRSETVLSHLVADSPDALRLLLDQLPAGDDTAALETAGEPEQGTVEVLRKAGFEPHVLTLRHRTSADVLLPDGPLDVHPVQTGEEDFVLDCLVVALGRGLQTQDATIDLREWARSRFPLTGNSVCCVGTLDGEPVCHGLGIPRPDRYSTGKVLHVVDVFVISGQHNRGFSRHVSSFLLRAAAERGHEMLESDLVYGPDSEQLLAGLRGADWVADRLRWRRPAVVTG